MDELKALEEALQAVHGIAWGRYLDEYDTATCAKLIQVCEDIHGFEDRMQDWNMNALRAAENFSKSF